MKDRAALVLYLGVVLFVTSVHNQFFLAGVLALTLLVAGGRCFKIAKKAALAVLMFNSIVTVSYILVTWLEGGFSAGYVVLMNLRVFLLTYLTFLLNERINLFRAFDFSPTLMYLMSLAYSQTVLFRRLLVDFRQALKSRALERLAVADLYRHGSRVASFFVTKSMADAAVVTEAMKSRGFFND
jgi:cobalt/nickel transport system permease protein